MNGNHLRDRLFRYGVIAAAACILVLSFFLPELTVRIGDRARTGRTQSYDAEVVRIASGSGVPLAELSDISRIFDEEEVMPIESGMEMTEEEVLDACRSFTDLMKKAGIVLCSPDFAEDLPEETEMQRFLAASAGTGEMYRIWGIYCYGDGMDLEILLDDASGKVLAFSCMDMSGKDRVWEYGWEDIQKRGTDLVELLADYYGLIYVDSEVYGVDMGDYRYETAVFGDESGEFARLILRETPSDISFNLPWQISYVDSAAEWETIAEAAG